MKTIVNWCVDCLKSIRHKQMFAATFMSAYEYEFEHWIKPTLTWITPWIVSRVIGETITSYILETEMCELYLANRLHIDNM